jgi:hypothetical protein
VTATVKDTSGNTLTDPDSWSFTITAQPVVPPVIPPAELGAQQNAICTDCHGAFVNDVAMGPNCVLCHTNGYETPDHLSANAPAPGATPKASGHNAFAVVGGKSKFDGTQGITLTDTNGATVTSTWSTPTVNVFWPQNDPNAPVGAKTGLSWNSVIGCTDCHSTAGVTYGPHGAVNWGMDSNYPYPYQLAVNSHATMTGIAARKDSTTVNASQVSTDPAHGNVTLALSNAGLADAGVPGTQYAVICAKCHKLWDYANAYTPGNYSAGSHGFNYTNATGVGNSSNTAHSSHHWDLNNGAADCVSCHIAVPHGWVRPRLLVNSYNGTYTVNTGSGNVNVTSVADPAPYLNAASRLMSPTSGPNLTKRGMGPLSATDQHNSQCWHDRRCCVDRSQLRRVLLWQWPGAHRCSRRRWEAEVELIQQTQQSQRKMGAGSDARPLRWANAVPHASREVPGSRCSVGSLRLRLPFPQVRALKTWPTSKITAGLG